MTDTPSPSPSPAEWKPCRLCLSQTECRFAGCYLAKLHGLEYVAEHSAGHTTQPPSPAMTTGAPQRQTRTGDRFPPLAEGEPTTNPRPPGGWTCFHCGENFKTIGAAQDHFGATPNSEPGCLLKIELGKERGLLMAMRRLEDALDELREILNAENWEMPEDAVLRAWRKVHDMLGIIQTWRNG